MHIRPTHLGLMLLLAATCPFRSRCVRAEPVTVHLPGEAKNIAFGGNGKYLVAHVREKQILAVVDLEQARLVKEIPVADSKVRFAAGAQAVVVSLGNQKVLARYSLKTFERELVQPIEEPVYDLCLGSASQGPIMVLVHRKPKFGGSERIRPQLFDPATLKPTATGNLDAPNDIISNFAACAASANGRVFACSEYSGRGISTFVTGGDQIKKFKTEGGQYSLLVSPSGDFLASDDQRFTRELRPLGKASNPEEGKVVWVPAINGPYCLSILYPPLSSSFRDINTRQVTPRLHLSSVDEPLMELADAKMLMMDYLGPIENASNIDKFPLPRRFSLVPSLGLLLRVPKAGDSLELFKIDLDAALKSAKVDFVAVISEPPSSAVRGKAFSYQVQARSSAGGESFSLGAGPPGMTVAPTGLVSWKVPASLSESTVDVVVAVKSKSGKEAFHNFRLDIEGEKAKVPSSPVPTPMPAEPAVNLASLAITPAKLTSDHQVVRLPGPMSLWRVAAGGRLVIGHLKEQRQLVVLDVCEAKILKYIPFEDDQVPFAASAEHLVTYSQRQKTLTRWSLRTLEPELSVPFQETVTSLLMGHASQGPVVVMSQRENQFYRGEFYDLSSLRRNTELGAFAPNAYLNISANGKVLGASGFNSPSGFYVFDIADGKLKEYHQHKSMGAIMPGPEGDLVFTGAGLFTPQQRPFPGSAPNDKAVTALPTRGHLLFTFPFKTGKDIPQELPLNFYVAGDPRPVARMLLPRPDSTGTLRAVGWENWTNCYLLIPAAKVLVEVADPGLDQFILHRFELAELATAVDPNYLFVTSRPPVRIQRGRPFRYEPEVWSKAGSVKVSVTSGPPNLKVEAGNAVVWTPPSDGTAEEVPVKLAIADKSGTVVTHEFDLWVMPPSAAESGPRHWTEARGGATLEAQFLSLDGEIVVLRRQDTGQKFRVPLERLSAADQAFVKQHAAQDKIPPPAPGRPLGTRD